MTTLSYGMASASQLLTKFLWKLDEDKTQLFPVASQLTNKNLQFLFVSWDRLCELTDTKIKFKTKPWFIKFIVCYAS